ncbi:signal peptide peptidase SppA [Hansschlegelia plantiphila]|uniref:Peptidase S49 domain-containing protein n=1 Tax=Hansschlegelia plantiphila TaxID=374655 RepID=A0A9W6MUN6_9HYPH|nr:signal peptide peptidase SppA [Hansschlegelia plantiphila]GLK67016.1 hypothetical protein GCM10008179_06540 [Hansschlegelia plantiphila]
MTARFPHLRAAIVRHPWAILPDRLEAIAEVIERRMEGVRLPPEEIAAIKGSRGPNGSVSLYAMNAAGMPEITAGPLVEMRGQQASPAQGSVIAVISIMGIIAQHANQVDDISGPGGTSTERLGQSFRSALADPSVKAIVFNIDSPGGNVHGVPELADEIFESRGKKPIVAQVNSTAASGAYWLACAADEIVVTPSGEVGSIGVYSMHRDLSVAADREGVKFTFISAGKYKVEGNCYEPLGDEAAAAIQRTVDGYYGDFLNGVARGRGVKASVVRESFGEGRMERAKDAVRLGMADRVGTMDDTLRRLARAKPSAAVNASADEASIVAHDDNGSPQQVEAPAQETDVSVAQDPGADAALIKAKAEADAFRRRRHAHRLRAR